MRDIIIQLDVNEYGLCFFFLQTDLKDEQSYRSRILESLNSLRTGRHSLHPWRPELNLEAVLDDITQRHPYHASYGENDDESSKE
jgi:hypothetical protein